jgi:hypothetical protein
MNTQQMELGFGTALEQPRRAKQTQRQTRAQWWFSQMRRVVDQALDWNAPAARPQQVYLSLPRRRTRV